MKDKIKCKGQICMTSRISTFLLQEKENLENTELRSPWKARMKKMQLGNPSIT
jgi:hypothetical protein